MPIDRKFIVSAPTLDRNRLTPERRRQLQEERIMEYIKRVDGKRPISVIKEFKELISATKDTTYKIISDLVRRKKIRIERKSAKSAAYYYLTDGKTDNEDTVETNVVKDTPIEARVVDNQSNADSSEPEENVSKKALLGLVESLLDAGIGIEVSIDK